MAELTRRYVVMALATDAPFDPRDPDGAFVLKPWKDPAAVRALQAYRDHCYPELARDLNGWLQVISEGAGAVRGGGAGVRLSPRQRSLQQRCRDPGCALRRPRRGSRSRIRDGPRARWPGCDARPRSPRRRRGTAGARAGRLPLLGQDR